MLPTTRSLLPLGLLFGAVQAGGAPHVEIPVTEYVTTTCSVTVYETKTIPVTQYVDVVVPVTKTTTALSWTTKVKTVIQYHTVHDHNDHSHHDLNHDHGPNNHLDDPDSPHNDIHDTDSANNDLDNCHCPNNHIHNHDGPNHDFHNHNSPNYDFHNPDNLFHHLRPLPQGMQRLHPSCSSAATVNLYFWPTDRPHTYPTTHVHPTHSYTFTYPSVYMFIPSAAGTNTLSQTVGPETTSWMLPLRLHQVSTIVEGTNITRQLTLSDLRTDCPQTIEPTGIATLDWRCNPVLAAPNEVKSWAWPCNACGRFGLFDPPYAVPTLTGRLVEPTSIVVPTVTAAPIPAIPTSPAPITPTEALPTMTGEPTATLPTVTVPTVSTTAPPVTGGASTFQANAALGLVLTVVMGMLLL
ncbi:hypothetical protein QBC39DRAFT_403476 [Podospora conica]|nr:hypothetical protein QBC39DRAFT_403476 [Schizothecium conicum]